MRRNDVTTARLRRRRLEDRRWILTREYWKQRNLIGYAGQDEEALVCLPTRSYSLGFLTSLGDVQRRRLLRIEKALARLDPDPLAACVTSDAPMDEDALRTNPRTDRCASCERRR
ncbi:MAG TPA: hypothetical protein VFE84_07060 [Patescibacteria group bacterium]|jgi:RNA polymerase-binding transcription factor DksA|nr:hypothetical protein [Patescibacteria group bacterium]